MTEHMSLMTTKLVILLKMIYRDKIMGEGLHATTTNLAEIREYGKIQTLSQDVSRGRSGTMHLF